MTKKVFSLTLILNALITITTLAGILYGFYFAWPGWRPYFPNLISGNIFIMAVIASFINIFPSASIGRNFILVDSYSTITSTVSSYYSLPAIYVIAFTSVSLVMLFLVNSSNMAVNTGRFFLLTGLTLVLDDLPDVSKESNRPLTK